MKKTTSTVCITLCLLFSSATIAVRADDGDGHDPGYVCVETAFADCPLNDEPPPQEHGEETSALNKEEAVDMTLIILELVNALLP